MTTIPFDEYVRSATVRDAWRAFLRDSLSDVEDVPLGALEEYLTSVAEELGYGLP